jgi:hypothetical protein
MTGADELHRRQRLWRLRRRRLCLAVRRRLDVRPADRARGVRRQPQVDALHVVQVLAHGQPPHHLAGLHRAEAHRALRPVAAVAPAPRRLGVGVLRELGDVDANMVVVACSWIAFHPGPGGADRRSSAGVVVAVEDEDGNERTAREPDAGVAEDYRSCRLALLPLRHGWRRNERCHGGRRSSVATEMARLPRSLSRPFAGLSKVRPGRVRRALS